MSEAEQRDREDRCTAAVHAHAGHGLVGESADGLSQVPLERVVSGRISVDRPPFAWHVSIIAACLPEQFIRTRVRPPPLAIHASRASLAQRPIRRAFEVILGKPPCASMACTTGDVARLARVRGRGQSEGRCSVPDSPSSRMPTACSGLFEERGKIGCAGAPTASITSPRGVEHDEVAAVQRFHDA